MRNFFPALLALLLLGAATPTATRSVRPRTPSAARPVPRAITRVETPPAPDSAQVIALLEGVAHPTCPLPGVATGGQIGAEHVAALRRSGFRTVLDLRGLDEARGFPEADSVRGAGIDYVSIPVTPASLGDSTFEAVRAVMQDAKRYPILVHCRTGSRVGVMLMPWLVLDRGWVLERAESTAVAAGMHGPMRDSALDYITRHTARR